VGADRQADLNWRSIRTAMNGKAKAGGMEARVLLGNAHAWSARARKLDRVGHALAWLANSRTTKGTGLLGGAWAKRKGRVEVMRSQPHAWHHAMYYLATLTTFGKTKYSFR
jgi:hypothetical protein